MIEYREADIQTASQAWQKMHVRGVPILHVSTEDLAIAAVSARGPATRVAAVAELVCRIKGPESARDMLSRVPKKKEK
jgi:hypothetical protein